MFFLIPFRVNVWRTIFLTTLADWLFTIFQKLNFIDVIFFSDPPGRPEITPGKALMTSGTEQKLTCEGKAGNPPAKLEWYRDSTMLSSQYTLEGDMVKAEVKITKINSILFFQDAPSQKRRRKVSVDNF